MPRYFFQLLISLLLSLASLQASEKAKVYYVTDHFALHQHVVDLRTVRGMVDELIKSVTAQKTVHDAWHSLIKPEDRIGIMVATSDSRWGGVSPEMVDAVLNSLESAGFSRRNVIVWGRSHKELDATGITAHRLGCRVFAAKEDYDETAVFSFPMLGRLIDGDLKFNPATSGAALADDDPSLLSSNSHFAKTLSSRVTRVINIAQMRDHPSCGISGAMFNITIPNVDNWRRFLSGKNGGDPGIPEIFYNPLVREKVAVNFMDGLRAQYAGGPGYYPNYSIDHNTLYASLDPVALDTIALAKLDEWCLENNLPSIAPRVTYLETAASMGIGKHQDAEIELLKVR